MNFDILPRLLALSAILTLSAAPAHASATSYCASFPNSTGQSAHIAWVGPFNPQFGALVVGGAMPGSAGFFLYSTSPSATPFGDGLQCVGSPALYLARKGTNARGTSGLRIWHEAEDEDLQWLTYPGNVGATWHFQYFYRDAAGPGGTGFNSTDGVAVEFGP